MLIFWAFVYIEIWNVKEMPDFLRTCATSSEQLSNESTIDSELCRERRCSPPSPRTPQRPSRPWGTWAARYSVPPLQVHRDRALKWPRLYGKFRQICCTIWHFICKTARCHLVSLFEVKRWKIVFYVWHWRNLKQLIKMCITHYSTLGPDKFSKSFTVYLLKDVILC